MGTSISNRTILLLVIVYKLTVYPMILKLETCPCKLLVKINDGTVYSGTVESTIEGVDADGNAVYEVKSVFVTPNPRRKIRQGFRKFTR